MFNDQFINDNIWLIVIVVAIDLVLKGIALWIAGRQGAKVWFVLLFILNTAGILPLFYILYFSRQQSSPVKS